MFLQRSLSDCFYAIHLTTVSLSFEVETSEYERDDSGYADRLAIKPSSRFFQIY